MLELEKHVSEKFLADDLPYRLGVLKAGIDSLEGKYEHLSVNIRNACFVGCAITVRQLIEFYGLRVDRETGELDKKPLKGRRDIYSESIQKNSKIDLSYFDKKVELKEVFIRAHNTGSKAAAHFTFYGETQSESDLNAEAVKKVAKFLIDWTRSTLYKDMEMPSEWKPYN